MLKASFPFKIFSLRNVANICVSGLYSIYQINALCTYRNMVHECTSLRDNVMQILSPMEPCASLLVYIYTSVVLPHSNPKIW
jgi:hypothetical protein